MIIRKTPFEIKAVLKAESIDALEAFQQLREQAESDQFPDLTLMKTIKKPDWSAMREQPKRKSKRDDGVSSSMHFA